LALLEGQAVKAAKTNSNLLEELTALREENASLTSEIASQKLIIDKLREDLHLRTDENSVQSAELVTLRNDFETLKQNSAESAASAHASLTAEIEQLKAVNSKYAVQLKRNATELSRRISQYATMQARLDDTMHKLSFLEQQGADKEQEFGFEVETKQHIFRSIKEENRSLSESLSLASDEIKRLRDEEYLHTCVISDMTREMHLLVGQRCDAQNSCQELQQSMQQLQYVLEEKITSLQNAEDKNQQFEADLLSQQKVVENCHQAVQQAKREVNEHLAQLRLMERKAGDAENEKKQLFELLSTTQSQLNDKQSELRESHNALMSLREERNTLRAMQQESLRHTDSLFDALTAEEQLSAALQAELEQKTQSVNLLLKEVDELKDATKQLTTLQSQLEHCEQMLLEKTAAMELMSTKLSEAEQINSQILQQLNESHQSELQEFRDENNFLKAQLEEEMTANALKVQQLEALNTAAANEIRVLNAQKEALSTQLERVQGELMANNSAYSDQISAAEQENEELLDKLHVMREEHSQLQSTVDSLTHQTDSLQDRLRDMFDELAGAQQRHADDMARLMCVVDKHAAEKGELSQQLEVMLNDHVLEISALEEEKNRCLTAYRNEVALEKEKDQQRICSLEEALMSVKAENRFLGSENAKLSGHHNTKQKIHYIETLKQQLQNLMDENAKLKDNVTMK